MEEDIEIILEEKLKGLEENGVMLLSLEDGENLKNLLIRYKQLEEEKKTQLEAFELGKESSRKRIEYDYIPKSLVKEKIEEYEKIYIDDPEGFRKAHFRVAIVVMKELLREE